MALPGLSLSGQAEIKFFFISCVPQQWLVYQAIRADLPEVLPLFLCIFQAFYKGNSIIFLILQMEQPRYKSMEWLAPEGWMSCLLHGSLDNIMQHKLEEALGTNIFRFYKWKIELTSSLLDRKWGRDDNPWGSVLDHLFVIIYLSGTLWCALFRVCYWCKLPGAEAFNCGPIHRHFWWIHKNHRVKNMHYPVRRNKTDWSS